MNAVPQGLSLPAHLCAQGPSVSIPTRLDACLSTPTDAFQLHPDVAPSDAELLVKTHWALARLRHRPAPGDMQSLAGAARRLVGDLSVDDRLTVMHAWGVLRCNPGDDVIRAYTADFRSSDENSSDDSSSDATSSSSSSSSSGGEDALDGDQCAKLLCAYGRTRHLPPAAHASALARRLIEEAERDALHPSAATLGLWGASLLGLRMTTAQLDVLARDAVQQKKLAPRSLAKIVWALAALGYDPTASDLAELRARAKARSIHWFPYDRVGVVDADP